MTKKNEAIETVTATQKEKIDGVTLTLDEPVMIGDKEHTEITLRKPYAGNMRGISITQLQSGDTQQVINFISKVSDWPIQAVERLGLGDFNIINNLVLGFLFPKNLSDLLSGLKESGAEVQVLTTKAM